MWSWHPSPEKDFCLVSCFFSLSINRKSNLKEKAGCVNASVHMEPVLYTTTGVKEGLGLIFWSVSMPKWNVHQPWVEDGKYCINPSSSVSWRLNYAPFSAMGAFGSLFSIGVTLIGNYKGLRDGMIRMLMLLLLASKKAQHNRSEKFRAS